MSADLFGPLMDTIALDPPWRENGGGVSKRGADGHYPTMHVTFMPDIILHSGVWRPNAERCNVWLWATANHLPDALWLLKELHVTYVSNIVWVKVVRESDGVVVEDLTDDDLRIGLGQHFRLEHEHLLYGRIGRVPVPVPSNRKGTVVPAAPIGHSVKPQRFYDLIEAHDGPGNRLEMFARQPRQGWTVWGNDPRVQKRWEYRSDEQR